MTKPLSIEIEEVLDLNKPLANSQLEGWYERALRLEKALILSEFKRQFPEHENHEIVIECDEDGTFVVAVTAEDTFTFTVNEAGLFADKISFQWVT